jgi:hypothetical protein
LAVICYLLIAHITVWHFILQERRAAPKQSPLEKARAFALTNERKKTVSSVNSTKATKEDAYNNDESHNSDRSSSSLSIGDFEKKGIPQAPCSTRNTVLSRSLVGELKLTPSLRRLVEEDSDGEENEDDGLDVSSKADKNPVQKHYTISKRKNSVSELLYSAILHVFLSHTKMTMNYSTN